MGLEGEPTGQGDCWLYLAPEPDETSRILDGCSWFCCDFCMSFGVFRLRWDSATPYRRRDGEGPRLQAARLQGGMVMQLCWWPTRWWCVAVWMAWANCRTAEGLRGIESRCSWPRNGWRAAAHGPRLALGPELNALGAVGGSAAWRLPRVRPTAGLLRRPVALELRWRAADSAAARASAQGRRLPPELAAANGAQGIQAPRGFGAGPGATEAGAEARDPAQAAEREEGLPVRGWAAFATTWKPKQATYMILYMRYTIYRIT